MIAAQESSEIGQKDTQKNRAKKWMVEGGGTYRCSRIYTARFLDNMHTLVRSVKKKARNRLSGKKNTPTVMPVNITQKLIKNMNPINRFYRPKWVA